MSHFIPVNEPLLNGNEKKYLAECIESGWISSEGPFVGRFEEMLAHRAGRRHGIAVCNGSVALEAAVAALGIGQGDEVILPTFTIISCAAAVIRAGAMPVLVDADPLTWNMDVSQIEAKITSHTKAIMAVHIYGLPVNMKPLLALAERHGLAVIEDAAEMLGQACNGRPCGSFGEISIFSFYPNKHVTTGEGGMIVTDDHALAERCRGLRNLCFQPSKRFVHEELGWNFRMTNLQAALGLAQLERLDEFVVRKRRMGTIYNELLADFATIEKPLPRTDYAENIYWVYGVVLKEDIFCNAAEVITHLGNEGIGTRPFFYPMHQQPVFQKMGLFNKECHPVAERLAERGFYLPSGLALEEKQIRHAAEITKCSLKKIIQNIK
jgi:perosamine synthetase